jgi:hypothetical protein
MTIWGHTPSGRDYDRTLIRNEWRKMRLASSLCHHPPILRLRHFQSAFLARLPSAFRLSAQYCRIFSACAFR